MRMVTGDNVKTAVSIALQSGILEKGEEDDEAVVMDGKRFNERITRVDENTGALVVSVIDAVYLL